MNRRAAGLLVAVGVLLLALGPATASAGPRRAARVTSSPSPTPAGSARRSSGAGFVVILVVLVLAALWQLQRGRRSTRQYADLATSHFERSLQAQRDEDSDPAAETPTGPARPEELG